MDRDYVGTYLDPGSKPEGVTVVPIDGERSATCSSGADYVVYVGDWCHSRLYVFTVDIDTERLTYEDYYVPLDEDESGVGSSFGDYCHPSAVLRAKGSENVFVLCQQRGTIMRLDTSVDQCRPTWSVADDDEAALVRFGFGDYPSCDPADTMTVSSCGGDPNCEPHDFAYDVNVWHEWVFVVLSGISEIVAVKHDDLATQWLVYKGDSNTFRPQEIEIAPSCDPKDPECVY